MIPREVEGTYEFTWPVDVEVGVNDSVCFSALKYFSKRYRLILDLSVTFAIFIQFTQTLHRLKDIYECYILGDVFLKKNENEEEENDT